MQTDWDLRYQQADTPWDNGNPSVHLKSFLSEGKVKPCRALELGCGTGTNAIFLAQLGYEVTAVDLSPTALERAREKARQAKVKVNFLEADVTALPDLGGPFPFVFDRGTYHVVRSINLAGFQKMLTEMVAPSGFYLVLAGNANTDVYLDKGPPTVRAGDLSFELESDCFDLLELKQSVFDGVKIDGVDFAPLSWTAVLQRREHNR
jgi:SAM-dependent methyltransferase